MAKSYAESLGDWFTNSLAGSVFDTVFGRGGDGVPGSSAETLAGQTMQPEIHVHAQEVNVMPEAPGVQKEPELAATSTMQDAESDSAAKTTTARDMINARDWSAMREPVHSAAPQYDPAFWAAMESREQQDAAYWAMRRAQEQGLQQEAGLER